MSKKLENKSKFNKKFENLKNHFWLKKCLENSKLKSKNLFHFSETSFKTYSSNFFRFPICSMDMISFCIDISLQKPKVYICNHNSRISFFDNHCMTPSTNLQGMANKKAIIWLAGRKQIFQNCVFSFSRLKTFFLVLNFFLGIFSRTQQSNYIQVVKDK